MFFKFEFREVDVGVIEIIDVFVLVCFDLVVKDNVVIFVGINIFIVRRFFKSYKEKEENFIIVKYIYFVFRKVLEEMCKFLFEIESYKRGFVWFV